MSGSRIALSSCVLVFALAACGEDEVAPAAVAAAETVEPLPVPGRSVGPVTGMPDGPGPGDVPLGEALPPAAMEPDGPGLVPIFQVEAPEPLQDNPEAGFGTDPFADPVVMVATGTGTTTVAAAPTASAPGAQDAVAAVQGYYDAVIAGDYRRAYVAWSDGGRASGRTPEQFAAGFRDSRIVSVSPGEPGQVEVDAGSRHVRVPVTVTSRRADGSEVQQVGSFVMRSSQGAGATPGWHIASAELRELQP